MKFTLLCLLPLVTAFAPVARVNKLSPTILQNELDDTCAQINEKTEEALDKADNLVLSRVKRFIDHAPMIVTLKALADKAGMAVSRSSINASPGSFTGLSTALPVPTWCFNVWAIIAIAQVASVAKSALASDSNELSQADITTSAMANFMATRAIASANPLRDTALTAIVSGYALRQNGAAGDTSIHNAALQLMSSFTTVLTILGLAAAAAARLSFLNESATSLVGLAAYYVLSTRDNNSTVKKAVTTGIIGGVLASRLAAGVSLSLDVASAVSGVTTLGVAYVAYESLNRLRNAVFA